MANRVQVSLVIKNEQTIDLVDMLKKEKRLKTMIVKFLDKYAENPEQVDLWLEDNYVINDGVSEENEKLTKLKSSLALFTTFVETARMQNESNVDNFTDLLTNDQYIKFRTEFEKSEHKVASQEVAYSSEIDGFVEETSNIEKEVLDLKKQIQELKTIVSEAITTKPFKDNESKIEVMASNNEDSDRKETVQKELKIDDKPEESDKEQGSIMGTVKEEKQEVEEIILEQVEQKEEDEEDVDITDALSIMDSLGV